MGGSWPWDSHSTRPRPPQKEEARLHEAQAHQKEKETAAAYFQSRSDHDAQLIARLKGALFAVTKNLCQFRHSAQISHRQLAADAVPDPTGLCPSAPRACGGGGGTGGGGRAAGGGVVPRGGTGWGSCCGIRPPSQRDVACTPPVAAKGVCVGLWASPMGLLPPACPHFATSGPGPVPSGTCNGCPATCGCCGADGPQGPCKGLHERQHRSSVGGAGPAHRDVGHANLLCWSPWQCVLSHGYGPWMARRQQWHTACRVSPLYALGAPTMDEGRKGEALVYGPPMCVFKPLFKRVPSDTIHRCMSGHHRI